MGNANAIAFLKMPTMARWMKLANDLCVRSPPTLGLAALVLLFKIGCINFNGSVLSIRLVSATLLIVLFVVIVFSKMPITEMTCAIMFGGLMSDRIVVPQDADPDTWAHSTPGEEIERFVFEQASNKPKKPKQMVHKT